MRRIGLAFLFVLLAACRQDEGTRCNPLQYSDNGIQGNCDTGLACVYPTAPNCGVAYCCKILPTGKIVDPSPNCQPDPSLLSVCGVDMGDPSD